MSWGILPLFWKQLQHVPSMQSLAHRIVWAFLILALLLAAIRRTSWLKSAWVHPKTMLPFAATAFLLGINWYTYIWAVNANYIVETSLGYFINPILSVLLGVLFLKEKLRSWQWGAIGVAAVGVLWLTVSYGSLPWVALTLAITFGFYGLIRKTALLGALEGLSLEAGMLFIPALGYLIYIETKGSGVFGRLDVTTDSLFVVSGLLTALPLLLFAAGARRIKLISVGLLQYLAPTLQLIIGVFIYGEPFPMERMVGFSLIWAALLIYSVEGLVRSRHKPNVLFAE